MVSKLDGAIFILDHIYRDCTAVSAGDPAFE
jgi:hypothetical protein